MDTSQAQEAGQDRRGEQRERPAEAAEVAKGMLQKGAQDVAATKGFLKEVDLLGQKSQKNVSSQLDTMTNEVDAAWEELVGATKPVAEGEQTNEIKGKRGLTDDIDESWEMITPSTRETVLMEAANQRAETLLEEESNMISQAKEILESASFSRAYDVFESEETLELVPGTSLSSVAKDVILFQSRYENGFLKEMALCSLDTKEFIECLHVMANTDTAPHFEDFESDVAEKLKIYARSYQLIRPGTYEDKAREIRELLAAGVKGGEELEIADEDLIGRTPPPGEKFFKVKNIKIEKDDAEFSLISGMQADLPKSATSTRIFQFEQALTGKELDVVQVQKTFTEILERSLTESENVLLETTCEKIKNWLDTISEQTPYETDPEIQTVASSFLIHHMGLNKDRTIPPFQAILKKKICAPMLGYLLQDIANDKDANEIAKSAITKGQELYENAIKLFSDVQTKGMPAFRKFNTWLEQEALQKHEKNTQNTTGTLPKGEFHVGRDTKTTTYVARMASQWGKMKGAERRQAIKHVDVSRILIDTVPRAILADYLKQNGINDQMMGIDGGYAGTGPQDVLLAVMSPEQRRQILTTEKERVKPSLDAQVKLLEANKDASIRQFVQEHSHGGVVEWMETLPKFTERSQELVRSGSGEYAKYLVVTQEKDAAEQMLAWVVQHAVWRGTLAPQQL